MNSTNKQKLPGSSTTPETAAPVSTSPALVTVRVIKNGVHAGGFILGKGAVLPLSQAEAQGLVSAGSAIALN